MTKKSFITFILVFSIQPYFAQAAATENAPQEAQPDTPCEQQQHKIQAIEIERDRMANEIYFLQDEIRRLNETLNNIRSQLGNEEIRPY